MSLVALVLLACGRMEAQASAPAQSLDELAAATSLVREGIRPWHLRVSFKVNTIDGRLLDTGTADVHWTSKDHEAVQVASTVFHGDLPDEDEAFAAGTLREVYLLRQLIEQTSHPVERPHDAPDLTTTEQTQKFGKIELRCLTVSHGKVPSSPATTPWGTEFCTNASDPGVLRIRAEPGLEIVRNQLATFQKVSVALDTTISYSGKVAITGHTDVLETIPGNAPESSSPSTSAPVPSLPGLVISGRKITAETPQYPVIARQNHISGSVVLAALIDTTGHIRNLTAIGSPDISLTGSSLAAVKTWTYTPYLLGGAPTEVETTITVNYNLTGGFLRF